MPQLYNVDSPINPEQRNNINATFEDILRRFSNLTLQISILSGGEDLEATLQRIEDAINSANDTTANAQKVLDDISAALNDLQTALQNSENATNDAIQATSQVQQEVTSLQNMIEQLGNAESYDNDKTYSKNNVVEYNGSSFMAIQETTGNLPPTLPSKRNDYWQLLAQRGIDGNGSVSSVNAKSPDVNGNVQLVSSDIGAVSESFFDSVVQQVNQSLDLKVEKNDLVVNVKDFGALGDGVTDDSNAIQQAIDFAYGRGGGIVYVPFSENGYLISSRSLVLLKDVQLLGNDTLYIPDLYNADDSYFKKGSTLLVTHGEGSSTGQAILMYDGTSISGINFFYPNQVNTNNPIVYPPAIRLENSSSNECRIKNVYLVNPYFGIDATGSHIDLDIENVAGQPLFIGLIIDNAVGVDQIKNVIFAQFWTRRDFETNKTDATKVTSFSEQNGTGIIINRADDAILDKVTLSGYKIGLHLTSATSGPSYGLASQLVVDYCLIGVQADSTNSNGWIFNGGHIIPSSYFGGLSALGVLCQTNNENYLQFNGFGFWGQEGSVRSAIAATAGTIRVNGCLFKNWGTGWGAIALGGGNANFSATDCEFYAVNNNYHFAINSFNGRTPKLVNCHFRGILTPYTEGNTFYIYACSDDSGILQDGARN